MNGGISPKENTFAFNYICIEREREAGAHRKRAEKGPAWIFLHFISIALNTILCASTGLHEYIEFPRRRSRYRLDNRCSEYRGTKSGAVILKDHIPFFPDCFLVPVLSARSLKITKVDCRQESGLNNWISNTYLPLQSKKKRERDRATAYPRRSCKASSRNYLLQFKRRRARASYGDFSPRRKTEVRGVLYVKIAKTPKMYHRHPLWPHASFNVEHLMENHSGRASE